MHEKLNIKFNVPMMQAELRTLHLWPPVMQNEAFGGYCMQSQDGDWRSGFEQAYSYRRGTDDGREVGLAPHMYNKRTDLSSGYFGQMIAMLESQGFHPRRSRVSVVMPGSEMKWHQDAPEDTYCVRLHVAIHTNDDAYYETESDGRVHIPADGHAHLVDTSLMHRSVNGGTTPRWHFFCEVWDTQGHSQNFVVTQSRKSIKPYHDMIGHEIYERVQREKQG